MSRRISRSIPGRGPARSRRRSACRSRRVSSHLYRGKHTRFVSRDDGWHVREQPKQAARTEGGGASEASEPFDLSASRDLSVTAPARSRGVARASRTAGRAGQGVAPRDLEVLGWLAGAVRRPRRSAGGAAGLRSADGAAHRRAAARRGAGADAAAARGRAGVGDADRGGDAGVWLGVRGVAAPDRAARACRGGQRRAPARPGRAPSTEWVSERALARERGAGEHLPDGVAITEGRRVAVEVELTVKSRRRVTRSWRSSRRGLTRAVFLRAGPHRQLTELAGSGRWPTLGVRELPARRVAASSGGCREHDGHTRAQERVCSSTAGSRGESRASYAAPQAVFPLDAPEPLVGEADGERGFVFAHRISGERALPVAGRMVLLSPARLCRHVLVCGATGSGRPRRCCASRGRSRRQRDAPVFYLDGKGDRETAERFCGLMADAGRDDAGVPERGV